MVPNVAWCKKGILSFLVSMVLILHAGCASKPRVAEPQLHPSGMRAAQAASEAEKTEQESRTALTRPAQIKHPQVPVRAIYVTSHVARSKRMEKLVSLVEQTELNAMVIDVNGAFGKVRAASGQVRVVPNRAEPQLRQLVRRLKNRRIYLIARVVTFKDPGLAALQPRLALQAKSGGTWKDKSGSAWIDPYRQEAWQYPLAVAEAAAKMGFDEIQFDYVRFPENGSRVNREVRFHNPEGIGKNEVIRRFLHVASDRVHRAGALVSADVFGLVASPGPDGGIGQSWRTVATEVDVISPMVYPSHYNPGMWGVKQPDLMPGAVVTHALQDAAKQNRKLNEAGMATAQIRPWLQGFTAGWVHPHQRYGAAQIREQVRAARRAGVENYMLWNAASRYQALQT
ncbi:putative glycoside hydrolase [Cohnella nanjingensis]|uniref:Putative glycoside hydrolase n=1 Tax=Cohnella nanjingensis TaxID=1387779 RepID=A0A7X0VF26_9BACL|nr:putative glycoside hydrolase [Cohnella nanjingensis]MBB6670179.1 putative glycoside hydrolase [Cohnella nanjingensis]